MLVENLIDCFQRRVDPMSKQICLPFDLMSFKKNGEDTNLNSRDKVFLTWHELCEDRPETVLQDGSIYNG